MKIKLKIEKEYDAVYLLADMGVRYWEDSKINGIEDEKGDLTPLRDGDSWKIKIRLEDGKILNWPSDVVADIHFKVCDAGLYTLLDQDDVPITKRDGYVPSMLSPKGGGYGDYVILNIDNNGFIDKWKVDLEYFEQTYD